MSDTPPLDDLLPKNDAVYEPPESLADMFARGGPIFEMADRWKFGASDLTLDERRGFVLGYEAAIWNTLLQTGIRFMLTVKNQNVDRLCARARQFRRTTEIISSNAELNQATVLVSGHTDP